MGFIRMKYAVLSVLNACIPKLGGQIFLYDEVANAYNAQALARWLAENTAKTRYSICIYTGRREVAQTIYPDSCIILSSKGGGLWAQMRSKYVFVEQNAHPWVCRTTKRQVVVQLWHGVPIKKVGYLHHGTQQYPYADSYHYAVAPSAYSGQIMQRCFHYRPKQLLRVGYPRCDELLRPLSEHQYAQLRIQAFSKMALWMPTFRSPQANAPGCNAVDFPILTADRAEALDAFLDEYDIELIIKPHMLQRECAWFYAQYKRIHIVYAETLYPLGLSPYQLLGSCDCLITDYSSVLFDYLLCDRPVIFTDDDYDAFSQSRGFIEGLYESMKVGDHVSTLDSLETALLKALEGTDIYAERRIALREKMNETPAGGNCALLCRYLNIETKEGSS